MSTQLFQKANLSPQEIQEIKSKYEVVEENSLHIVVKSKSNISESLDSKSLHEMNE